MRRRLSAGMALLVAFGIAAAVGASSPGRPSLTPDKQSVLDHQFAVPVDAAPPAPKNPFRLPPYDPPQPRIGLDQVSATDVQAPVSPALFRPTTQWVDVVGGRQVAVYGGSAVQQGEAAAVYVWVSDLNEGRDLAGTGLFVGDMSGPLTLTSLSGGVARFRYPGGTGDFDLATHEFHPD
jgi:hypothetical protein